MTTDKKKSFVKERVSEIALLILLVALVALIRVYHGGEHGLMVVWKGEPSFTDTIVYVPEMLNLPAQDLKAEHPSVYSQLVAMDILEDNTELEQIRARRLKKRNAPPPGGKSESTAAGENKPADDKSEAQGEPASDKPAADAGSESDSKAGKQ